MEDNLNLKKSPKPTLSNPTPQGKKLDTYFNKQIKSTGMSLKENMVLNEKEESLKKKIFKLDKMETLVHTDEHLSKIFSELQKDAKELYGYHWNEVILNMIFNDYILNSPKNLQKYKNTRAKEKTRRGVEGIAQLQNDIDKEKDARSGAETRKQELMANAGEEKQEVDELFGFGKSQSAPAPMHPTSKDDTYFVDTRRKKLLGVVPAKASSEERQRIMTPFLGKPDIKQLAWLAAYDMGVQGVPNAVSDGTTIDQVKQEMTNRYRGGYEGIPALGEDNGVKKLAHYVGEDYWSRRVYRTEDGREYVEVDGQLHSMTSEGEPIAPVKNVEMVDEDTSAGSSGSYSMGLDALTPDGKVADKTYQNETTTSASSGQYSGPAIWAKSPANSRFAHKTAWKGGKIIGESVINGDLDYFTDPSAFKKYIMKNEVLQYLNENFEVEESESFKIHAAQQIKKLQKFMEDDPSLKNDTGFKKILDMASYEAETGKAHPERGLPKEVAESPIAEHHLNTREEKIQFIVQNGEGKWHMFPMQYTPELLSKLSDGDIDKIYDVIEHETGLDEWFGLGKSEKPVTSNPELNIGALSGYKNHIINALRNVKFGDKIAASLDKIYDQIIIKAMNSGVRPEDLAQKIAAHYNGETNKVLDELFGFGKSEKPVITNPEINIGALSGYKNHIINALRNVKFGDRIAASLDKIYDQIIVKAMNAGVRPEDLAQKIAAHYNGESNTVLENAGNDKGELYYEIEMRLRPTDPSLPFDELNDIANEYGVDFEEAAQTMAQVIGDREQRNHEDVRYVVADALKELNHGVENHVTFEQLMEYLYANNDMSDYDQDQLEVAYEKLTRDPNQLALFEASKNFVDTMVKDLKYTGREANDKESPEELESKDGLFKGRWNDNKKVDEHQIVNDPNLDMVKDNFKPPVDEHANLAAEKLADWAAKNVLYATADPSAAIQQYAEENGISIGVLRDKAKFYAANARLFQNALEIKDVMLDLIYHIDQMQGVSEGMGGDPEVGEDQYKEEQSANEYMALEQQLKELGALKNAGDMQALKAKLESLPVIPVAGHSGNHDELGHRDLEKFGYLECNYEAIQQGEDDFDHELMIKNISNKPVAVLNDYSHDVNMIPPGEMYESAKKEKALITEKAVSKKQQKFFGMVHAAQKGKLKHPSKAVAKVAGEISDKDADDFASTKHKGLPEKKKKKKDKVDESLFGNDTSELNVDQIAHVVDNFKQSPDSPQMRDQFVKAKDYVKQKAGNIMRMPQLKMWLDQNMPQLSNYVGMLWGNWDLLPSNQLKETTGTMKVDGNQYKELCKAKLKSMGKSLKTMSDDEKKQFFKDADAEYHQIKESMVDDQPDSMINNQDSSMVKSMDSDELNKDGAPAGGSSTPSVAASSIGGTVEEGMDDDDDYHNMGSDQMGQQEDAAKFRELLKAKYGVDSVSDLSNMERMELMKSMKFGNDPEVPNIIPTSTAAKRAEYEKNNDPTQMLDYLNKNASALQSRSDFSALASQFKKETGQNMLQPMAIFAAIKQMSPADRVKYGNLENYFMANMSESISENWHKEDVVNPKEKGKHSHKTLEELRSQLANAKKEHNTSLIKELEFAIRAKTGWGKVKENETMNEERKIPAILNVEKLGDENAKNFKRDQPKEDALNQEKTYPKDDGIHKAQVWPDPSKFYIEQDPKKYSEAKSMEDIEKAALAKSKGALANIGDATADGKNIPKRNLTKEEGYQLAMNRGDGMQDIVYDNKPSEKFEKRMEQDMGEHVYDARQEKMEFKSHAPMYNKDTQPTSSGDKKDENNKFKVGYNTESTVSARFKDQFSKFKLVEFKLADVTEVTSVDENAIKLSLDGMGNKYALVGKKINENAGYGEITDNYDFYLVENKVVTMEKKSETKTDEKTSVNESAKVDKMKHLMNYKPNNYVDTKKSVKF